MKAAVLNGYYKNGCDLEIEEAACVPLTALTALQAFELMQLKVGETVFILGGTGSLGAMAIPVAKSFGLTVITNGNGANEERVRKLGADQFIDYKKKTRKMSLQMWTMYWILWETGNCQKNSVY